MTKERKGQQLRMPYQKFENRIKRIATMKVARRQKKSQKRNFYSSDTMSQVGMRKFLSFLLTSLYHEIHQKKK